MGYKVSQEGSWAVGEPLGVVGTSHTARGSLSPLKHLWNQTGRLQLLPKQQLRPIREEDSLPSNPVFPACSAPLHSL